MLTKEVHTIREVKSYEVKNVVQPDSLHIYMNLTYEQDYISVENITMDNNGFIYSLVISGNKDENDTIVGVI